MTEARRMSSPPRGEAPLDQRAMPRISLVVPAYNEAVYLPALLASVGVARQRYAHGAHELEVIVADNASTDTTAAVAGRWGARVVNVERSTVAGPSSSAVPVSE